MLLIPPPPLASARPLAGGVRQPSPARTPLAGGSRHLPLSLKAARGRTGGVSIEEEASAAAGGTATAPALRESDLFRLWHEQRFPPGVLQTVRGVPVRVRYRGRPGSGPGPDFRDALVSIGGAPARLGDVELHVHSADFQRHGHATDRAYSRVVLHVVFDAGRATETALPGGGSAPVLALRPWLERRAATIAGRLAAADAWREPCHSAVRRHSSAAVLALLHAAGEERVRRKAAALADHLWQSAPEQALYRAICGALGLSHNVTAFQTLADRAPLAALLRRLAALPAERDPESALRENLLQVAGFAASAAAPDALPWRLAGLRPGAHPAKRIGGLAALLVRHRAERLLPALTAAAACGPVALLRALQAPGIGRPRAVEIAVNAVLPYLIATGAAEQALALARALPAADAYGRLSTLGSALISDEGAAGRSLPLTSVLAQQGALGFDEQWCRRGGCGVCPFS